MSRLYTYIADETMADQVSSNFKLDLESDFCDKMPYHFIKFNGVNPSTVIGTLFVTVAIDV